MLVNVNDIYYVHVCEQSALSSLSGEYRYRKFMYYYYSPVISVYLKISVVTFEFTRYL